MKTLFCLLLAVAVMQAASLTLIVKNDAGTTISTTVLTVPMTTITALNAHRLANPAAFPAVDSYWKAIIGNYIRDHVLVDYQAAIIEQRRLIDVAAAEIERLKALAVQ